jgi:intracellular septation protein A
MGEVLAAQPAPPAPSASWMLVCGGHHDESATPRPTVAKLPLLCAVARRGLPNLIESTIIPALMFFVFVKVLNAPIAMAAVLVWAYAAILRRVLLGSRIPAILVLATLGLTVRTLVGLVSGSTFAYFIQPVATTVALAVVFLGSVVIGRPVIARLAHDFCPIAPEVAGRPAVLRLFGGLTVLWAGVHVVTAAITFGMLVSMPVATFVAFKTVACLAVTVGAIVVTILWALRIVRSEKLVFATP